MTVRDIIKGSLRLIGALAAGETPTAEEQQDAISAMRGMLDSWSTDGFTVQYRVREELTLVSGTGSYTIGTSGTFNTARPIEIEQATIKDESASPAIEMPLDLITLAEFAQIQSKSSQGIPEKLYRTGNAPLDTLTLWPIPSAAYKLVLYSRKKLLTITDANTTIDLPEGYERAIKFNLAVELAPEYGKSVPVEVGAVAIESKANIMRLNGEPTILDPTAALIGGQFYNIFTGS